MPARRNMPQVIKAKVLMITTASSQRLKYRAASSESGKIRNAGASSGKEKSKQRRKQAHDDDGCQIRCHEYPLARGIG